MFGLAVALCFPALAKREQAPAPALMLMSWVPGFVELFGGLAILLGLFVGVAAVLNICDMLVAMFTVHLASGLNFLNITGSVGGQMQFGLPGFEVNLLYIRACWRC